MNIIDDRTFGRLEFDYGWRKNDIQEFWGKERKFEVVIDAYTKEDEITKLQKETFVSFYDNFQSLMDQALKGIFNYYKQNYTEITSQGNPNEKEAPIIKSENEMLSIIQPLQLIICNTMDNKRVVGLTCNCTWDQEHGIGVKFVDEKITEIGTQDIVL
jgi:hypothetical protein